MKMFRHPAHAHLVAAAVIFLAMLCISQPAYASQLSQFESPFETFLNILTGKWGKTISAIMLIGAGLILWKMKESLEGSLKVVVETFFYIGLMCCSVNIVDLLFDFSSGALI